MNKSLSQASRPKTTIRRLPMWGKNTREDQVNFSWPSQEQLNVMRFDVSLKSIEFKSCHHPFVSSVKCILSNNISSPVFESAGQEHYHPTTIKLNPKRPAKRVQAFSDGESAYRVTFKDSKGRELDAFDPAGHGVGGIVHTLQSNE